MDIPNLRDVHTYSFWCCVKTNSLDHQKYQSPVLLFFIKNGLKKQQINKKHARWVAKSAVYSPSKTAIKEYESQWTTIYAQLNEKANQGNWKNQSPVAFGKLQLFFNKAIFSIKLLRHRRR